MLLVGSCQWGMGFRNQPTSEISPWSLNSTCEYGVITFCQFTRRFQMLSDKNKWFPLSVRSNETCFLSPGCAPRECKCNLNTITIIRRRRFRNCLNSFGVCSVQAIQKIATLGNEKDEWMLSIDAHCDRVNESII